MKRDTFVFYRSWVEGADHMKGNDRRALYEAIINYALDGKDPEKLSNGAMILFPTVKRQIDKNNQRYKGGLRGGRPEKETETTEN